MITSVNSDSKHDFKLCIVAQRFNEGYQSFVLKALMRAKGRYNELACWYPSRKQEEETTETWINAAAHAESSSHGCLWSLGVACIITSDSQKRSCQKGQNTRGNSGIAGRVGTTRSGSRSRDPALTVYEVKAQGLL